MTVGAGSGIAPFYATGKAYLAGPYKGAQLSLAIVTPAVAGPFDLGAVVVRTALHIDPETTQIHAVSDPLAPDHRRRAARRQEHRPEIGPSLLHPQPNLLRPHPGARHRYRCPGSKRRPRQPLPGRRLQRAEVQTEALPEPQRRHQARPLPGPESARLLPTRSGLCQHRLRPGDPAPFGVHRTGPLQDDLHQSPVRRRSLPSRLGLRLRPRLHAIAGQTGRRPGLPALL